MIKPQIGQKAVLALIAISLLSACGPPKKERLLVEQAVNEFHARFNNSAFSDIYDGAAPRLRDEMAKDEFIESMGAMRQGQGAVVSSKEVAVEYNSSSDGNEIKITFEVTYEKGIAHETFSYLIVGDRASLVGYRFFI